MGGNAPRLFHLTHGDQAGRQNPRYVAKPRIKVQRFRNQRMASSKVPFR
jgi:hypothetical protein